MPVRDLIEAGALAHMVRQIEMGRGPQDAIDHLRGNYDPETISSWLALYSRAETASQAASSLESGAGPFPLPASQIPGYYPGRNRYLYTVRVATINVVTGRTEYRELGVRSSTQLDYQGIFDEVDATNPAPSPDVEIDRGTPNNQPNGVLSSIDILSVERDV